MQPTHLVADTICRTVELGLTITNAAIDERFTWIDCQPVEHDPHCRNCGEPGALRDHVTRVLTDLPITGHPVRLRVRVPRFTCDNETCSVAIFRQSLPGAAADGASTTRRVTRWILQRLAVDKMSISAVAKALGIGWDLTNDLALAAARDLVYDQPGHWGDVRYLGPDFHKLTLF